MACNLNTNPIANWGNAGIDVNFDGSNICVRAFFGGTDAMGTAIVIDKTYPVGTSDLEIAQDIRDEFLNQASGTFVDMTQRCFRIRELIFESLKY